MTLLTSGLLAYSCILLTGFIAAILASKIGKEPDDQLP